MAKWTTITAVIRRGNTGRFIAGLAFVISLGICAAPAPDSVSFSYKDWDLICDNTLTCRAAGYSSSDTDPAATVLLTRKAGPSTAIVNRVMLADYDGDIASKSPGTPILYIDDKSLGRLLTVDGDAWQMSEPQFTAFKLALRRDSKISFKDKVQEYIFSGAGSSAVLLKMDDVQGRPGTPGAVFKKGSSSETNVKMPVAIPVIVKAPVRDKQSRDMTPEEMARIKPTLLGLASQANDCREERINGTWQIANLNENQSLVIVPCWMGAYNFGDVYYVISNDMTTSPERVTDSATSYEDGVVYFSMKDRGLGDCWSNEEWVWDGKRFDLSAATTTGRCRLIRAGGAWDLPTRVTKVVSH